MEMIKVEVVSREIIKPSSPTPHHLRTFKLSFLDQILAPPMYVSFILFFKTNNDDKKIIDCSDIIKKSLSKTLTKYYPLAGRIKDDNFVDCNDDGVEYFEARVISNVGVSQFIQHSTDVNVLERFLPPCKSYGSESEPVSFDYGFNSKVLLAVQVNVFDCGGVVIGVRFSHKMADTSTMTTFINDWAAISRGSTEQIKGPCFDLPSLFPQRDLMSFKPYEVVLMKEEEVVTKRFVFKNSKIAELKERNMDNKSHVVQENTISRVGAVSTFMWMRFMHVLHAKDQAAAAAKDYLALYTVNIRPRIIPPLPTNSFGNIYALSLAMHSNDSEGEKDHPYLSLVGKVKDSLNKINHDYVRELQTTDELVNSLKLIVGSISSGQAEYLCFTSWCRFPFYEADFGWGKPIWVTTGKFPIRNIVVLMDTNSGDGVEAYVNMTKEDMDEFERDEELLSFVS